VWNVDHSVDHSLFLLNKFNVLTTQLITERRRLTTQCDLTTVVTTHVDHSFRRVDHSNIISKGTNHSSRPSTHFDELTAPSLNR